MQYILYPAAIYLLFIVIQYVLTFLQVSKIKFQYPKYQITKSDTVPIYLKKLFQTPIKELEAIGFKPCSYIQYQPVIKVHQQTNWELLLYNQEFKTYASTIICSNLGAYMLRSEIRRSVGNTQGAIADQQKVEKLTEMDEEDPS